jgi:hypothetical protein
MRSATGPTFHGRHATPTELNIRRIEPADRSVVDLVGYFIVNLDRWARNSKLSWLVQIFASFNQKRIRRDALYGRGDKLFPSQVFLNH